MNVNHANVDLKCIDKNRTSANIFFKRLTISLEIQKPSQYGGPIIYSLFFHIIR